MASVNTSATDERNKLTLIDDFNKLIDKILDVNGTVERLEPPQPGSSVSDWITFFMRNLFPFIIWILAMIWCCYITYYNTRLIGFIVSRIVNRFIIKNGYFSVGSFSFSAISGKIMFRDVIYITEDYSIRIQDGWLVFRYWVPYLPKDPSKEDFSHLETRLLVLLNGLEVHVYNRTQYYKRLEKLFGLPSRMSHDDDSPNGDDTPDATIRSDIENSDLIKSFIWRDLIPVTKFEIIVGRFVFGNHLIPSTLSITFEEAHITYTSRPTVSPHDLFTHIAKCRTDSLKVILAPSPKFLGITDEPPRFMGEGFVVFQSNRVEFYYYQDDPGFASDVPEKIELANGDIIEKFTSPAWGLDIKCGKGTDFSYGPWADRQREYLYNMFYPQDYQIMELTKKAKFGEKRLFESFDIRLNTLADATIDILFSKNKETNAVHVNAGPGSYLEITIPWINKESGYVTHILGQILHLDASTSLQFRSLAQSETLQFDCTISYPRLWNDHQEWQLSLTGCKATVSLIFAHKAFFQALIEDWSGKMCPDILKFVPYTWKWSIILKDFELLTLANEHNWIDCSSIQCGENTQLAICGELFDMTFDLPFVEFLPPTVSVKLWIQGESLDASLYLPEANTHRDDIHMLYSCAYISPRDGSSNKIKASTIFGQHKKWRNVVTKANGWTDCWTAPIVALSITFNYWPIPPKAVHPKESEITTPEREEILLSPLRPNRSTHRHETEPHDLDPTTMEPDVISVELEIGPSNLCLYGSVFRILWNIKENYLGECQKFFDLSTNVCTNDELDKHIGDNNDDVVEIDLNSFDSRIYRPLEVIVSVTLHDIQGHLMKCCNEDDPPCPCIYMERLSFELHKVYRETRLQLLLSPIVLSSTDVIQRSDSHSHLKNGFLTMSTLQFRGHAMFSGVDRPLDSETLEYSWLVEVIIGDITGRLTLPQTQHIITSVETFFLQVIQTDCSLQPPIPYQRCLHDLLQSICPQSTSNKLCPYSEDLKYRMVRLSLDNIELSIVESNVAVSLQVMPIKLSTCNIHSCQTSNGFTALINQISIRQFVMTHNTTNASSKGSNSKNQSSLSEFAQWIEVSNVIMGPIFIDSASFISVINNYTITQETFLKTHDNKTKRLWFLWSDDPIVLPPSLKGKCGCVGGCAFFGRNKNGINFFNISDRSADNDKAILTLGLSNIYKDIGDLEFGESLLHRGEYVLGEKPQVIDEDDDSFEINPLMESFSSLSPTIASPFAFSNDDATKFTISENEELNLDTGHAKSRLRVNLLSRQLSSPSQVSHASYNKNVLSPPPFNIPIQSPFLSPTSGDNSKQQRSHSFSESGQGDEVHADGGRRTSQEPIIGLNINKKVDFTGFDDITEKPPFTRPLRTKSLESASSASERYYSAEDISTHGKSSASSDTIKSDTKKASQRTSDSYKTARQTLNSYETNTSQATVHSSYQSFESSNKTAENKRDGDSNSISSTSFISAVSSQDEFALVDLHNQMEKPILESPLLMSSYLSHLSKYVCRNWDIPPPLPHFTPPQVSNRDWFLRKSNYWRPKFRQLSYGFSSLRIVDKQCDDNSQNILQFDKPNNYEYIPGAVLFEVESDKSKETQPMSKKEVNDDQSITKTIEIKSEKMTILVKINNCIDIKFSPLSLEGLKTFIDSITPTLASLHFLTVINHLNLLCLNEVASDNKLKKEKTMYLGQLNAKAWRTLRERQGSKKINRNRNDSETINDMSLVANQFEENKTLKIHAFVHINTININIIQSSIVEEVISFAALDNVKDLTCVSVLSLCIKNSSLNFSNYLRQKRTLHTFMDQSSVSTLSFTEKALMTRFFTKKRKKELTEIEAFTIETVDTQLEESVGDAKISSIHVQLSRLKNSSTILKDAMLTVIPCQKSRVRFKFEKAFAANFNGKSQINTKNLKPSRVMHRQEANVKITDHDGDDVFISIQPSDDEHILGFIMFECGIESINIKGVKKKVIIDNKFDDGINDEPKLKAKDDCDESTVPKVYEPTGNSSSCVCEISSIWFNFAAPPRTPNTRKIDFTRLDWHLLSTAAPSINAWITVIDRFLISSKLMRRLSEQRISSVLVCLMTSGLEVPGIHIPPQSKHLSRQLTPLAKSLQDDPSCQLVAVLRRYMSEEVIASLEADLNPRTLPPLRDLQRGIVALCRQWKNSLYMPLFVQQSTRFRKGDAKHPLRILLGERVKQISIETESADEIIDNTDETTNLLKAENGILNRQNEQKDTENNTMRSTDKANDDGNGQEENTNAMTSSGQLKRKLSALPNYLPRSSRASIALLSAPLETIGSSVNKAYEYLFSPNSQNSAVRLMKRDESQISLKSSESSGNIATFGYPPEEIDGDGNYGEENLYWWMARQQEYMKNVTTNLSSSMRRTSAPKNLDQESKLNTLTSVNSNDEKGQSQLSPPGVSFLPTALVGDVRVIFNPLLLILGVKYEEEEEQSALSFGQFGTKVSVCGRVKLFKIDIVESENGSNRSRSPSRQFISPLRVPTVNIQSSNNLSVESNLEAAAFVCDGLNVELDMRKVKDYEKPHVPREEESSSGQNGDTRCPIVIVGPEGMNQITTLANFNVNLDCIVQRVNMPLLRLLHQFAAMYDNVKETRLGMKLNRVQLFRDDSFLERPKVKSTDTMSQTPSSNSYKTEHIVNEPIKKDPIDTVSLTSSDDSDYTLVEEPIKEKEMIEQPKCWKTMYHLLQLYEIKPETKTILQRVGSLQPPSGPVPETKIQIDEADYKGSGRYEPLKDLSVEIDSNSSPIPGQQSKSQIITNFTPHRKSIGNIVSSDQLKNFTNALMQREWTPLVVFGVCKIKRVALDAMLSGLKLEGELSAFHVSLTHKQKTRGSVPKRWHESSMTGQLGQTMIALLEEIPQQQQLVVKMTVGKSQTLVSSQNKKGKDSNSALLTIGPIVIDIPQHPVALHGMMARSSKQISTTLQELRSSRLPSRASRQQMDSETITSSFVGQNANQTPLLNNEESKDAIDGAGVTVTDGLKPKEKLIKPIVVQFTIILDSFTITAALLPSLRAQYQIGQVTSSGFTGHKAKFIVDLLHHTLSFNTKVLPSEANLPSAANVELPPIHVSAEYMEDPKKSFNSSALHSESFAERIVLRKGSYLNAMADIGSFEHSLTTDLLNHLLLVQKVFMKEVNEVVQKMSGTDVKLMEESIFGSDKSTTIRNERYFLFSLHLRMKGIQITATTPTNSAVRLETGAFELQLSNRVQNLSTKDLNLKLFIKVQVDLNVALGQLIKNAIFEEAEPEFQQLAYFKTRISMRNALQDEMIAASSDEDKEAVLITLYRPLIYIQPLALDKAVLVWLNYKNAYEYWTEQRANLNKEVITATQQVIDKVQPYTQLGSQALGTLFLQLTVVDLGACLPITSPLVLALNQSKLYDSELKAAVVVTLENTRISACSCGSLVSKAQFTGLCIRFADDFETSLDDWKPDANDQTIRNLCIVSEGTYEICSRTLTPQPGMSDAKWLLNVSWKMEGFDIHVDTSIGKHCSALFKTMTALAGDEDDSDTVEYGSVSSDQIDAGQTSTVNNDTDSGVEKRKGSLLRDLSLDTKKRSRIIEKELNEQAKIINDLRQLGASKATIEQEVQRLHELEAAVFNNFRRDVIKKLRRPSVRPSASFRDKTSAAGRGFSTSLFEESNPFERSNQFDKIDKYRRNRTISLDIPEDISPEDEPDDAYECDAIVEAIETSPESPAQNLSSFASSLTSESQIESSSDNATTGSEQTPSSESDFTIHKIKTDYVHSKDLKKQGSLTSEYGDSGSSTGDKSLGQHGKHQIEPNIDFEFDIKVFFNSGKCVLHTKDPTKDEEQKKMQKERSFSGGPFDNLISPNHVQNKSRSNARLNNKSSGGALKTNTSTSRFKLPNYSAQIADFTVFLIPGLDIKLHYNSKTVPSDSHPVGPSIFPLKSSYEDHMNDSGGESGGQLTKRGGNKKAALYAWMTLHSIPDETLIGPHILDFLEQALEPIPITVQPKTPTSATAPGVFEDAPLMSAVPTQYEASFPVDVIVYFHVQPTVVRFTCLPVSRVQCLLQLPSIDLVFSSKKPPEEPLNVVQCSPPKSAKFGHRNYDKSEPPSHSISIGGLSVTGCLADFSLYIFHPYGGQKKTLGTETSLNPNKNDDESIPSISFSDRKDSLSLQVEFVKVNIARTRKAIVTEKFTVDGRNETITQSIRFSVTCDIGSASFKYDMRRLSEILAFPKAWYRKAIWKRMFIGEQTMSAVFSDQEDDDDDDDDANEDDEKEVPTSLGSSSEDLSENSSLPNKTNSDTTKRDSLYLNLKDGSTRKRVYYSPSIQSQNQKKVSAQHPWEAFILFSVNLSKLRITMNIGNVMGNTNWETRGLRSDGRISIDSGGHKSFKIDLGLDGSTLDARGGIVGGIIELSKISSQLSVREDRGKEPEHTVTLGLHTLEKRLDYMGTSVLMLRISDLDVTLKDEWRIDLTKNYHTNEHHPTKRPAFIFVHAVLRWDQLQILMSKSTTPDIMKMIAKLEEFFTQQFNSSKRVFYSLQPKSFNRQSFKSKNHPKRTPSIGSGTQTQTQGVQQQQQQTDAFSITTEARHHRHWERVLRLVSGLQMSTLPNPLPKQGTILGGTVELKAQNVSLACFYGINFRSKAWGTFSLRQSNVSFSTEAQSIVNETGDVDTHIIQNLSFTLGRNATEQSLRKGMANVCRISRNVMFHPQFRQMHEWFHYAFYASDIDDVDRFPFVPETDIWGTPMPSTDFSISPPIRDRKASISPKPGGEFHHTREIIFAFPSMQLELKTEHLQGPKTPLSTDVKPTVDCTFISDFDDHIFVAVDAEAYFFLHELILSYIKEKETNLSAIQSSSNDQSRKDSESIELLQRDWREFVCHTWHLEPTVRLLSWAGKNIEPYGVDYILQRLGFSQARTTIPKWIQRGAMDPIDKILSLVMYHTIYANRSDSYK